MSTGYRLPRTVADRLETALSGRKNAPACLALAAWLGRFWSAPRKLVAAFPIDRRAVAGRDDLGLSEARVRGAIAALVEIGFLDPQEAEAGKRYQRTAEGLHRRPVTFRFGSDFGVEFARANARSQAARGAPAPARRSIPRPEPQRSPAASLAVSVRPALLSERPRPKSLTQVAQIQSSSERGLIMGEENRAVVGNPLEAALARWAKAISG